MYKKHSRFFSRVNRLAGLDAIYPGLANAAENRARGIEKYRNRHVDEKSPCRECQQPFFSKEMVKHLYLVHELCKCRFCKQFVPRIGFTNHIKEAHGVKTFRKWVKKKAKDRKERQNKA